MYMVKLKGTHVSSDGQLYNYVNVCQSIEPVAGKKYIFSCDSYARTSDGGGSILLWSNSSKGDPGDPYGRFRCRTRPGEKSTLILTYRATEMDTQIGVSIECDPESECYLWNFSFREQGSEDNLLNNPDFATGSGSWLGWSIQGVDIQTAEESEQVTELYGHEIVNWDSNLIETMVAEDATKKDYNDPNSETYIQTGGADKEANLLKDEILYAKMIYNKWFHPASS